MQRISFITNTAKNNLEYTKLLLRSLKQNLDSQEHQIIVFIDSDNEGILEWLLSVKHEFADMMIIENTLDIPIGYQRNKTLLTEYAKYDIVSYLQSDMVIGPHYDTEILRHAKRGRILSATRVEPPLHGISPVTVTHNLGLHPDEFNMEAWNTFSNSIKRDELIPYFFAPMTYYKEDWIRLGGYDTVFRRAREDSDLVQRCLHANIELIQTFSANVYHFTCVSSRGKGWFDHTNAEAQSRVRLQNLADSIEMKRFIRKWGNFNHGETPLFKLDIDVVVRNYTLDMVESIEPFFTRVWVESEQDKHELLRRYHNQHTVANTLLGTTEEMWERYQHLYRTDDFESVINVGVPETFHIKVELDFSKPHGNVQFLNSIQHLYDLLGTSEPGVYQLDEVTINVDSVHVLPTETHAQNPPFEYSVLTIH